MVLTIEKKQAIRASLVRAIEQVYPFPVLLTIGVWNDRTSWRIEPHPSATTEQNQAAADVIAAFDLSDTAQAARQVQANRAAAEALMEDRSPMLRVILAKAVVDYQGIPALRNAHATLGAYLAAIKTMAKSAALD